MKSESYCDFILPPYISFNKILKTVQSSLNNNQLDFSKNNPKDRERINHTILHNKDGKYAWRPFQLIHPAIYVSLVNTITEEEKWETICKRFKEFKEKSKIKCTSIPVVPPENKKNTSEQITHWWEEVEQQSIKMSLDYEYLIEIDISNCYGSIYTHSIPWAIHGKSKAKNLRSCKKLIGNIIDKHLQSMSYGQTNGIPQGSALMHFIAEMVLGYIDIEVTERIKKDNNINRDDYNIIRYRDDYRIFTNNPKTGEEIVKFISEILIDFGMSLNPTKTKSASRIIKGSIKSDKLYWMQQENEIKRQRSLQKHLILIHIFSIEFSNSGSLKKALKDFYDKLSDSNQNKEIQDIDQLISIITDIAYYNPRTYPDSVAIISKLISSIENISNQKEFVEKVHRKFKRLPNTGHLDIWLQRITIGFSENFLFDEPICKLVAKENISIWESNWLKSYNGTIEDKMIIDEEELNKVRGTPIKREEFSIFPEGFYH